MTPTKAPSPTLAKVIAAHAERQPSAAAFKDGEATLSWRDYHEKTDRLASLLIKTGFSRNERLAVLLPDTVDTHVAYVACEKAGLIPMAISARAGEEEIAYLIEKSGAVGALSYETLGVRDAREIYLKLAQKNPSLRGHFIIARECADIEFDSINYNLSAVTPLSSEIEKRAIMAHELFLLNTTSGTTGMPKCVMQSQQRWFEYHRYVPDTADLSGDDVFLRGMPASPGFGMWTGHFSPTILGATTVVLPKFSVDDLLAKIERFRVSVLTVVSTQLIMLTNKIGDTNYDLSSLRYVYTGGEAVPYEQSARFEEMTGAIVLQFYGSNEAGAISYTTARDPQEKRLRTAGKPIKEMNLKLINEREEDVTASGRGQPACKGPLTCLGYYKDEIAQKKLYTSDGYLKMEDIVQIDDDGYLKIVGRVGDFIIRGGRNISAAAVEQSVLRHPNIKMAAALAMPDPVFGERVCVYVVLDGLSGLTHKELAVFLNECGVTKYDFPERVIVVDELPVSSGGKVSKGALKQDLKRRLAAEAPEQAAG